MEPQAMGRVLTEAKVESLKDLWDAERGMIPVEQARRLVLTDALVDTGATTLALPTRFIQQLGLKKVDEKRATSSAGTCMVSVYEAVRLTLLDRFCSVDVMEVPDDTPVLIGQIPLEMLDLVVDLRGRRLIGNPAHGGEHVLELY
jgi:predicted aspartyl protease